MNDKRKKHNDFSIKSFIINIFIILFIFIVLYFKPQVKAYINKVFNIEKYESVSYNIGEIPEYDGSLPYVIIDNNIPNFDESDYNKEFELYSELDYLGRCGTAYANISRKTMPKKDETRGEIYFIYPSGWNNKRYEGIVDKDYLYNRCHLIAWKLAAENDNELNLITGTRYMNAEGMLPFEDKISDYLWKKENKNNHVLYRVTPIFEGENLVASGVQMEAYSVEDNGEGVCFNVYVYNVQPGIEINYLTGDSKINI